MLINVSNVNVTVINVTHCYSLTLGGGIGDSLEVWGEPGCVFDLYDCSTEPATIVGTFLLDIMGHVDTGIVLGPDDCYEGFITGTNILLGRTFTVPTLGQWGLVALISLLLGCGLVYSRRWGQVV